MRLAQRLGISPEAINFELTNQTYAVAGPRVKRASHNARRMSTLSSPEKVESLENVATVTIKIKISEDSASEVYDELAALQRENTTSLMVRGPVRLEPCSRK